MTASGSRRAAESRPVRVLVVDDHPVVREGMATVLDREPDLSVVGAAASIGDALHEVRRVHPHVVFLDHHLPDGEGIDACPTLLDADPSLRIVIVTRFGTPDLVRHALAAGACGYLVKHTDPDRFRETVRAVMSGARVVDASVQGPGYALSGQEFRVLELLVHGHSNAHIAGRLGVSAHSVRTYVSRLMSKLGARNRTAAAGIAIATGLVHREIPTIPANRPQK